MDGIAKENKSADSLARLLQQEGFSVAIVSPDVTYEELEALIPSRRRVVGQGNDETKSTD